MRLFDRMKLWWLTRKHSSKWSKEDKKKISDIIDRSNEEIEVVREEIFEGGGKPYRYFYDNGSIRSEGYYYSVGYDKTGSLQDEKFQGRNVDYYENGQIQEITFYINGIP